GPQRGNFTQRSRPPVAPHASGEKPRRRSQPDPLSPATPNERETPQPEAPPADRQRGEVRRGGKHRGPRVRRGGMDRLVEELVAQEANGRVTRPVDQPLSGDGKVAGGGDLRQEDR